MNPKNEEKNVVMTISMTDEMKKTLKVYAAENDMNVSMLIRHILKEKGPEYGLNFKKDTNK
jgi:hypothetical protein